MFYNLDCFFLGFMNIDLFCFFYKKLLMLDIIIVVDKNMLFKELSILILLKWILVSIIWFLNIVIFVIIIWYVYYLFMFLNLI